MAARDQLVAYGYVKGEDGRYRRPGRRTQVWQEVENGGWLRFDPDEQGREVPEPYQVNSNYQGTSGLHKIHHPGAFDWVYPEEYVERLYRVAVEAERERLQKAMERKGQVAAAMSGGVVPPAVTADQLASMQNAQAGQAAAVEKEPEPERKRHWWD